MGVAPSVTVSQMGEDGQVLPEAQRTRYADLGRTWSINYLANNLFDATPLCSNQ